MTKHKQPLMWDEGQDLPLFCGTPQPAHVETFAPVEQDGEQGRMFDTRPEFGVIPKLISGGPTVWRVWYTTRDGEMIAVNLQVETDEDARAAVEDKADPAELILAIKIGGFK